MLKRWARSKSSWDPAQRFSSSSLESCRRTVTLVNSKLLMTTDLRKLSSNSLEELTNVVSSHLVTTFPFQTSRSGLTTSFLPDNSDTLSSLPLTASSLTKNAERDTLVVKSLDSSTEWAAYYSALKWIHSSE